MRVRTRFLITTMTVLVVLGGLAALLPLVAGPAEPREIIIVARQMAFYVAEGPAVNPTIQVSPGERVKITLISQDAGFDHDFAIAAWRVNTSVLHGEGQSSVVIQVPNTPGTATYVCSRHASMMKGTIEVTRSRTASASGR